MPEPPTTAPSVGLLPTEAVLERSGRENFPVASVLLPRDVRDHLMAVYGFARLVDDIGDEVPGDRRRMLDLIEEDLGRVFDGRKPLQPLLRRLGPTVRTFELSPGPFLRLIDANRRDQTVAAYRTYEDLLAYCELSANPVGHLVLAILRADTPERRHWSDAVCTGLQLAEHWQDVAEDARRGRVYVPLEDLERFRCTRADLTASPPRDAFRRLMAFEVGRARALLDSGLPLVGSLRGRARVAVAAYLAGGLAALEAVERSGHDVSTPPRATRAARLRLLVRTLLAARATSSRRRSEPDAGEAA